MKKVLHPRKLSLLAGIAVAVFAFAAPDRVPANLTQVTLVASAEAQARLSISVFYNELAPHGRWIRHPAHGYVWTPRDVRQGWRPYTEGRWIHTVRHGWYWQSSEPFGWATYHYGRWGYQRAYGWYWVPGTQWAPAWVVWRVGGDSIGWAPIAPDRRGYAIVFPTRYRAPVVESWVFVEMRYVSAALLLDYVVPVREIPVYLRQSPNVITVNIENNIIINQPIEITQIQQVLAEPMMSVEEVIFVTDPAQAAAADSDPQQITAFQADLATPTADETPPDAAESPEEVETVTRLEETVEDVPSEADSPSAATLDDADVEADLEEAEEPPRVDEAPVDPTPAETPSADEAPADAPAVDEAPADEAPADTPPVDEAPADTPAVDAPPAEEVPASEEAPPADAAPAAPADPPPEVEPEPEPAIEPAPAPEPQVVPSEQEPEVETDQAPEETPDETPEERERRLLRQQ
ncbi:MAG: hypothetical protein JJU21_13320 [Salinarimonas sp.]|nr:hypothetical protein [Salinarimonas sp.]